MEVVCLQKHHAEDAQHATRCSSATCAAGAHHAKPWYADAPSISLTPPQPEYKVFALQHVT